MKKCKKLLKPLLFILGILCACLAFAGCGNGEEWQYHTAGNWKEADGVFFGLISKDDAPEGYIDEGKVQSDLVMQLDKGYYYIIDFVLQAAEDNSGFEQVTVSVKFNSETALTADMQETSSSLFTNTLDGEEREITVTYTVPDYAEVQIKKRIVLELTPKTSAEIPANVSFTSGVELVGVPKATSDMLDIYCTPNLKYEENESGGYTVTKSEPSDGNLIIPKIKDGKRVTAIGEYAFRDCGNITGAVIPDGVTDIGKYAFGWCTALTGATIPDSVINIGEHAFYYCTRLTDVTIPSKLTTIEAGTFSYCVSLTGVTIPESVTKIGYSAFSGCRDLAEITVELNNAVYKSENNCVLTKDGKELILGCKTSVIPNGVESIGHYSFENCSDLMSIAIPDSVTSIGVSAFSGCVNLTAITIPDSVTSIDVWAFYGCSGLKEIVIPNGVTVIERQLFAECYNLKNVTIPAGIAKIDALAFENCEMLTSITFNGSLEQWYKVSRANDWDFNTGNYTLHCTDGHIGG